MNTRKQKLVKALMDIEAISLKPAQPFTWSSGLKSPIYCDNRLIMSYPAVRSFVEDEMVKQIKKEFPAVEGIAGTATAGIPHAAIIADKLNLPMIYVRSNNKNHGKKNAIEGRIGKNQKIVMVEDLISTGASVISAADKVKEAGGEVIGVASIFSYQLKESQKAFQKQNYSLKSLICYPELIDIAVQEKNLSNYKETLSNWYKNPVKWSETVK